MACGGGSVASVSVVSKDSIFDRVLKEENERLKGMGMGERDFENGLGMNGGGVGVKGDGGRDKMRGGRRVEI